jgi:hypothetical protein
MQAVIAGLGILRRYAQKLGPYVLLEILLPGGTLLALLLFLYRSRMLSGAAVPRAVAAATRVVKTVPKQSISGLQRWYLGCSQAFYPRPCERLESHQ